MRWLFLTCILLIGPAGLRAQNQAIPARFEVEALPDNYPQTSPKATLQSVLKAIDRNRFDYMIAHLVEPSFIDQRMQQFGLPFSGIVAEVQRKLKQDPPSLRELRRLALEGSVEERDGAATISSPDLPNRKVYLKQINARWFMENRKE